ncbi:Methyltransferase-like protein 5 [Glycine soja]|uniref:Methyltransferase-like protein 5 n=1 Tax=Glycine soja TaxID=3848 RepID=A0A0B2SKR6_GLYSO|nr:Methyltransferase-like protein 5 [Glycine soja]
MVILVLSLGPIVDTVIMNSPFGSRKKGAHLDFLSVALKHVKRIALRDFNASSAEVICELRFDVPKMYKFHKKEAEIVDLMQKRIVCIGIDDKIASKKKIFGT